MLKNKKHEKKKEKRERVEENCAGARQLNNHSSLVVDRETPSACVKNNLSFWTGFLPYTSEKRFQTSQTHFYNPGIKQILVKIQIFKVFVF